MTPIAQVDLRGKLAGRRVVASVSGGKDSAALSLWLAELGIDHDRVFLDTGWEHELTYEYLRGDLARAIGPIQELRAPKQMEDLIRAKAMFPSRQRRFCTQELKVKPMQRYLNARVTAGEELINAVGIRRAESLARSQMAEWEWSDGFDCEVWRPLIHWTEAQVIEIHRRHGLKPNPLYMLGATRVGCWPCIYAREAEVRLIADIDPERIGRIKALEEELTASASERAGEHSQRSFFQAPIGRVGTWPVDDVVRWSRTTHGGRQFDLLPRDADAGCMRWGLCETDPETDGTP